MGEAFWYHERLVVVSTQDFGMPVQKSRGAAAQIHCNIEHLAAQAAYELDLRIGWKLKVHTAHRAALGRKGVVDLDYAFARNERLQLLWTKHALQIATVVANGFAQQ